MKVFVLLARGVALLVLFSATQPSFVWAGDKPTPEKTNQQPNEAAAECASLLMEPIPLTWVNSRLAEGRGDDPLVRRIQDTVQGYGLTTVMLNREIIRDHNESYTTMLPQGLITNQKQSGRCWIFAGLNMLRSGLIAEGKVPANFEFSENYLHFFNMLEKSNLYLEESIAAFATPGKKLSQIKLRAELMPSIGDGGWYEYFLFLVSKYGVIPKSAMLETASSESTATLLSELKHHLARTTSAMLAAGRKMHDDAKAQSKNVDIAEYRAALRAVKERGLRGIWKILVTHLGQPPASFDMRMQAEPKVQNGVMRSSAAIVKFTPKEFAEKFVGYNAADYVVVATFPRRKADVVYEKPKSAIGPAESGSPTFDLRFLNVSSQRLEELSIAAIEGGQTVWFTADVGKDVYHAKGIMHPKIFERDAVYGFSEDERLPELNRGQQQFYYLSTPNHAMQLIGFDQPVKGKPVIKFRNENSWGDQNGSEGIYHLYREWFHKHVYQIIVHKRFLSEAERKMWDAPAVKIGEKDPLY